MKKLSLTFIVLLLPVFSVFAQKKVTWIVDKEHARVSFSVNHILISETAGIFREVEGTVKTSNVDFMNSEIDITIDVKSIDTGNKERDDHLRSNNFLNAEKYPRITFKSTSFKKTVGSNYKLAGFLTIRDITRPVSFDVVYNGIIEKDRWGKTQAGFKLIGSIDRFDYDVKWNDRLDNGDPIVGRIIDLIVTVELTKVN